MKESLESISARLSSSLSFVSVSLVLLSYAIRRDLLVKRYHKVILYIFLCDLFGALGGMTGTHHETDAACYFQWFTTNYFMLASILWGLSIIIEIYFASIFAQPITNYWYFTIFCWGFPLLVTLLPLSSCKVGPPNAVGGDLCFIVPDGHSPVWLYSFWLIFSWWFWIWLSVFVMIILYVVLSYKFSFDDSQDTLGGLIYRAADKVKALPVIHFVVWIPSGVVDTERALFVSDANIDPSGFVAFLVYGLPFLTGFFSSFSFFYSNPEFFESLLGFLSCGAYIPKPTAITAESSQENDTVTFDNPIVQLSTISAPSFSGERYVSTNGSQSSRSEGVTGTNQNHCET